MKIGWIGSLLFSALALVSSPPSKTPVDTEVAGLCSGSGMGTPTQADHPFRSGDVDEKGRSVYHGWVSLLYFCGGDSADRTEVWLTTDTKQRFELRIPPELLASLGGLLALDRRPVTVRTSSNASISSILDVSTLALRTVSPHEQASVPATPTRGPGGSGARLTPVPFVTILVRFPDALETPAPRSYYVNLFRDTYPGVDHYFRDISHNQMSLAGSVVTEWVTLPHPTSYYKKDTPGFGTDIEWQKIMEDATAAVDNSVDFTKFYGINLMLCTGGFGDFGGVGGGSFLNLDGRNGFWGGTINHPLQGQSLMAHEMGHAIGFPHSSSPYNRIYGSKWDTMSGGGFYIPDPAFNYGVGIGTIAFHRNIGEFLPPSVNSSLSPQWLSGKNLLVLPGQTKRIRLERISAVSTSTSERMATIYLGGSATQFITVEARQFVGYDDSRCLPAEGVVLHHVDLLQSKTDPTRYNHTLGFAEVIDGDNDGDPNDEGAAWIPGETYRDAEHGVTISVTGKDGTGYLVTIAVDADQPLPNVVSNTNDSGPGSLRNAMQFFQRYPEYAVTFNLVKTDPGYQNGIFTISPKTPLPRIDRPNFVLDGSQQTTKTGNTNLAGPEIQLDGSKIADWGHGVEIAGSGAQIRGLAIGNFPANGIYVAGGVKDIVVKDCFVGLNAAGTAAAKIKWDGVYVAPGVQTLLVDNCVLSGNGGNGLGMEGVRGVRVAAGRFGVNPSGNIAIPNTNSGIATWNGTSDVTLDKCQVAGNAGSGVSLDNASDVRILGGWFGVNAAGTGALPNVYHGVSSWNGTKNLRIEDAILSGNGGDGIGMDKTSDVTILRCRVGVNAAGTAALANAWGGVAAWNGSQRLTIGQCVVSGNTANAVSLDACVGGVVKDCQLGTGLDGITPIPNKYSGVSLFRGTSGFVIDNCLIAANSGAGVYIGDVGTSGNRVQNCRIGTNKTGQVALPNAGGVSIGNGATNNIIGGDTVAGRCIISGNQYNAIALWGAGTSGNRIQNCYLGVGADGLTKLPNQYSGVSLDTGVVRTTIGGEAAGQGCIIAGNGGTGIWIRGSSSNVVRGNRIGIDASGNALANGWAGIELRDGAQNNYIGGTVPAAGNQVANADTGIYVGDATTFGNTIQRTEISKCRYNGILLDAGANAGIAPPRLTSGFSAGGQAWIVGEITGKAGGRYRVEAFSNPGATTASPVLAERFLAGTWVVTDAAGRARFVLGTTATAKFLTATVTDSAGNTSTLSPPVTNVITSYLPVRIVATSVSGSRGSQRVLLATITSAGSALASKTVTFKIDGVVVGNARADSRGMARLTYKIPTTMSVGSKPIRVEFYGDSKYAPGAGDAALNVLQ